MSNYYGAERGEFVPRHDQQVGRVINIPGFSIDGMEPFEGVNVRGG